MLLLLLLVLHNEMCCYTQFIGVAMNIHSSLKFIKPLTVYVGHKYLLKKITIYICCELNHLFIIVLNVVRY